MTTAYFIESDFSDFDFEVFTKDQIRDTFISAIRTMPYDDDGITVIMGASEPIEGVSCISATIFSDYCTVELFKEVDDRIPVKSKNLSLEDSMRAFYEFYNGVIPAMDVMSEQKDTFVLETDFTEFPVPVRSREQIENIITLMPEVVVDSCECECDDECCEDDECECCCGDDEAPYVVLQAPEPIKGADYIQAMYVGDWWYVEISFCGRKRMNYGAYLESDAEVIRMFNEFMDGNIPDTDGWTKVKI